MKGLKGTALRTKMRSMDRGRPMCLTPGGEPSGFTFLLVGNFRAEQSPSEWRSISAASSVLEN